MEKALLGLDGVLTIKVILKRDLLEIQYDAEKVTPAAMLKSVEKQGFKGKIVTGG